MKKRILSVLITLVMLVGLVTVMSVSTSAAGEHTHCICGETHASVGDHTAKDEKIFDAISTYAELVTAATTGGSVYLTGDITLEAPLTVSQNLSLCLNGYDLIYNGADSVIIVSNSKTLNITDCGSTGTITGSSGDYGAVQNGTGTFNLYAGTITGNKRGVYNGGTFSMYGGNIAYNSDDGVWNRSTFNLYGSKITYNTGWGVNNNGGTFTMYNGEISHNSHNAAEATVKCGVMNSNGGTFTMNGGKIAGNNGNGVQINGNQNAFTMNGGKITENVDGIHSSGVVTINGGEISSNTSDGVYTTSAFTMNGGEISGNDRGVMYEDGLASVSSAPVIKDNANGNFCDYQGTYYLTVSGALTDGAYIGVTLEETFGEAAGPSMYDDTLPAAPDYIEYFYSDEGYGIYAEGDSIFVGNYITEQPNAENNYTVKTNDDTTAKFQWYKIIYGELVPVDDAYINDNGVAIGNYGETGWTPMSDSGECCYFVITMNAGDMLTAKFASAPQGNVMLIDSGYSPAPVEIIGENTYVFTAPEYGVYAFIVESDSAPTVEATLGTSRTEDVEGQTAATLDTTTLASGTYACKVTWDFKNTPDSTDDDHTVTSAAVSYSAIHWAVVQKDSDVILYLGNAAHVMETGETLYADGAQGIHDMVLEHENNQPNQPYRAWYTQITKVVVESEIQPTSCAYWFDDLYNCTEMDLRLLNTGSVTTMENMFNYCSALTSLDLSHFDTSNVKNMENMFCYCYELAYLDLSSFDLRGIAADSTTDSTITLFTGAMILTLKTPKINPYADAFDLYYDYSDEQGNLYTELPVSASAEGVETLYMNFGIQYDYDWYDDVTGGEGNPTSYAYNKAYSITLTAPQRAGFVFDGWKVDEGASPEGVTVVGNTLTIPRYTTCTVYIDSLWKPYTVSVSGSNAPYTATIDPLRDDVTYSWHEYRFGSDEITDESAIYSSEYSFGTYDPETGWTPDSIEYLYLYFDVSLKSGDTVTVTFANNVDVRYAAMMTGDWGEFISGVAQAENVILFTIPEDGRYVLVTNRIATTAKAIHTGVSVSNTAAFTGATFSTGEIGTRYVAKATFTDGGEEVIAYSDPFTYAEQYFTVTFDYGTLGSETKTFLNGETVTPPAPVFAGKVFAGWYDDAACTQPHDFSTPFTANDTLYAKYVNIPKRSRVSFVADGRLVGIILYRPSQTELTTVPKVPAKEGYVGTWETYTLNGKNMIVRAVYTPIN